MKEMATVGWRQRSVATKKWLEGGRGSRWSGAVHQAKRGCS